MFEERSWKEFRESGMLWWINMILHTFGWAIAIEVVDDKIVRAYPARVGFRGFNEQTNTDGYFKVAKYIEENAEQLLKESKE